jgi:hypothetical protein
MKLSKSRLLALSLVVFAVAALGTLAGLDQAEALPCCSSCWPAYVSCFNNCGGDPVCEDNCEWRWMRCATHCSSSC